MHVAIYVPLLIPALAALAARPLAARLRPVVATWLLTLSALALAAASSAVLGMLALSALLRIPFVAGVGHLSDPVISRGDAVSLPVAIIAGGLLAAAAVAATRAVWWRAGAIGAAYRRARTLPGAGEIVVTEDAAADAYTIPGWPCRIVITRGMLSALAGEERGVLLSHERAHARNAHYLFTSAARLAAAANPLLGPGRGRGRLRRRALGRRACRGTGGRQEADRPRDRPRGACRLRRTAGPRPRHRRPRPDHRERAGAACRVRAARGVLARYRGGSPHCSRSLPACRRCCWSPRRRW